MIKYNDIDCCFNCKKQFNDDLCKAYCKSENDCHAKSCMPGACKYFERKGMVTITQEEYNKLLEDSNFLEALRGVGVDNWSGYSEAFELLEEWNAEE